jgi:hemerythrin HHE cation binding domain-containing protein
MPALDDSTRPHRKRSGPDVNYTDEGRRIGEGLVELHDMLRSELSELRGILRQVRDGAMRAGDARAALNEMALRQNDWALGGFCARYCGVVTQHHGAEDVLVFPHLARREPQLRPVIDRLSEEHLVIQDAIQEVDRALGTAACRSLPSGHQYSSGRTILVADRSASVITQSRIRLSKKWADLGCPPVRPTGRTSIRRVMLVQLCSERVRLYLLSLWLTPAGAAAWSSECFWEASPCWRSWARWSCFWCMSSR